MDNNYFSKKSVLELINNYKFQVENNIVDKKWIAELKSHLQKRSISNEEFELIQANFSENDFVSSLKKNITNDIKNTNSVEVDTISIKKNEENYNTTSSSNLGLYLLLIINTAILVFFLIKYLEFQSKINELQNNMNNLIH